MVDVKRLFVFVLIGMFLFSMVGDVVGAVVGEGGVVIGYDDDGEPTYGDESVVPSDGDVGGALSTIASRGLSWGQDNLKFTEAIGGVNEYKWLLYAILLGMIVYTVISSFFKGSMPQ